jgi:hypothetical protein
MAQVINWGVIGGLLWFSVMTSRTGEREVVALLETVEPAAEARS